MTQDQYGQPRGAVRGDVSGEEIEDDRTDETKPMTRFQKVASALRGDKESEQDETEPDQPTATRTTTSAQDATGSDVMAPGSLAGEATMANTPVSHDIPASDATSHDYWDEPNAAAAERAAARDDSVPAINPDVPVDETNPDVPDTSSRPDAVDHESTEPDMFGSTARPADETGTVPPVAAAEGQPGAATIADVPAGASVTTATGAHEADVPAADFREAGTPETATPVPATPAAETAGSTGRHAAAAQADRDLRPGESTVALGDFSDLTYGDLVPDAEQFAAQWQQIQFRFVDDPHASVSEAAEVVAQVTAKMEAAIQERQRAIQERQQAIAEQQRSLRDRWGEGNNADTENLRATLRMYKTFLDQLIGSKATS